MTVWGNRRQLEWAGQNTKKEGVVQRKNARDLRKVASPLSIHLSVAEHMYIKKLLEAGKESFKSMVPEGHTGPEIVIVPNGQSEKSHNSRGIS